MSRYEEDYAGQQVCCTCAYYHQHYTEGKKSYFEVNCGHCVYPRLKSRCPDQTCGHWKAKKEEPASES